MILSRNSHDSKTDAATQRSGRASFTLIEMMASMAIIVILMAIIASAIQGISKLWLSQRNHVQTFQSGRSALDLMVRDLTSLENPRSTFIDGTSASSVTQRCNLQFIEDAGDPTVPNQPLNSLLGSTYEQVPYSSSVFGQARLDNTAQGNLWVVGYYLARSKDRTKYQLRKFLISPATPGGAANPNYLLYPPNAPTYIAPATNNYAAGTPYWIYLGSPTATTPNPTAFQTNSYIVSENVVALWFRCLDNLGQPIAWLDTATPTQPNTTPFKFNSAAPFVMAPVIGATNSITATNFIYQVPNNVLLANRLPAALEVTAITVDSSSVSKLASSDFASANAITKPADIPVAATNYLQQIYNRNIPSARVFETVVRLPEAN